MTENPILVTNGTGKTGRRVAERLRAAGRAVRATLADGVNEALGRPARPFRDYARDAAASGAWT